MQTKARAGYLGAHSVRVLTEHGLSAGLLRAGRHGTCVFRAGDGEFALHYDKHGRGHRHGRGKPRQAAALPDRPWRRPHRHGRLRAHRHRRAELLIVERLLPETDGTDSLAVPWDIHMLCNVGGRERTEAHYRALLSEAGFELTATHPLPLDAHVLRARRSH